MTIYNPHTVCNSQIKVLYTTCRLSLLSYFTLLQYVWHSFKYCISEKGDSVRWSMSQTGHVADRMKSRQDPLQIFTRPPAQSTAKRNLPSRIHTVTYNLLSCASPAIDFQNIFGNLRQTEVLRHSAGSSPLNDVNYPATNDSNTPENVFEISDIHLPCRSYSFKCKSGFISPRHKNSSLCTHCISNWQRERETYLKKEAWTYGLVANNLPKTEKKAPPERHRDVFEFMQSCLRSEQNWRGNAKRYEWALLDISLHMGFNIKMGDTLKLYFREDDITKEITSPYSCHYLPKSVCWPASG